jgi:hypothetical protein
MGLLAALGLKPRVLAGTASPSTPSTAVDKNEGVYISARAAVKSLINGLNAHAQKSHIAGPIGQANDKLKAANAHAAKKEWSEAAKRLAEAKTICVAAKKLADEWTFYAAKRGVAKALMMAFGSTTSTDDIDWVNEVRALLVKADGFAKQKPADWVNALAQVAAITNGTNGIQTKLARVIVDAKGRLAAVQRTSADVQAFAKRDIDAGKAFIATADKAFAAGQWSLCLQNCYAAMNLLGPAIRMVTRRGSYSRQRVLTVAVIAQVKAVVAVADRAPALEAMLKQADTLAAYETRKFEEGTALLKTVAARAELWKALAAPIAAAQQDRAKAEAELAMLDKHAAAANVAAQRDAVRKLLADAKVLVSKADAATDPGQAWAQVAADVARARADLASTKKLADGMGPANAAQAAAAKPGDVAALRAALAQLIADGKAALAAPHADQAAAEFKTFREQSVAAATALAGPDAKAVAAGLAAAATALAAAKTVQAAHAQFVTGLAAVNLALKALQASPRAAAIGPRIDAVTTPLAEAMAKDKAHDGAAAIVALRRAKDAMTAAKTADAQRAAFDAEAATLNKRVEATKDAKELATLQEYAAGAKALADDLAFVDATKLLKRLKVRLDWSQLKAAIKANPNDPNIIPMANQMVKDGGAAAVDALIQAQPNGNDTRVITALARGRYGIGFRSGAAAHGGDQAKAMKAICAMFATMPQDVRNNRSISMVSHEDKAGGGSYDLGTGEIKLFVRPGKLQQSFGPNELGPDVTIDADCEPKDASPVEFLAFAAAHEVGHSLDDARGFMATHGARAAYGGWVSFGASLKPLADIIGGDARFTKFYETPEQRRYVLDKLMNVPTKAPDVTKGSPADHALTAFNDWYTSATSNNIYRRQSDCDAIQIGNMIYHEVDRRNWVGYLAAARKKALTSYQFSAPGEWFAELYAGYRSGKLKYTHPAMAWLEKL